MRKTFLNPTLFVFFLFILLTIFKPLEAKEKKKKNGHKIKVLLIDGQSVFHSNWKEWTPVLLKQLDDSGLFQIDVATSPMKGESLDKFNPKFKDYDVVVSTYDGDTWSMRTKRNLEKFVASGGGLVIIHAADNAFPDWEAYNLMIGIGGWGNRTESAGPYVYIDKTGETKREMTPGPAGHHGPRHEYVVETRMPEHPIMKDIPARWLHTEDELYDQLRGPANNMEILATAYSSEEYEGTQRHEPILMTINYEDGRIFHTVMGHHKQAISCVGFMTTFIRGCQWVAKKEVAFEVPDDFPTENASQSRTY
jgi:type 1 glutamine amidotransferase